MRFILKAARLSGCVIVLTISSGLAHANEAIPLPAASQPATPQKAAPQPVPKPGPWDLFKSAQGLAAGRGVPKDVRRARQIFEQVMASDDKAAAGAAAVALARLAADELKDPDLAAHSLERGIALGDVGAMVLRAQELAKGRLPDRKRATELYLRAAKAAKTADLRKAAYFGLGKLHEERPLLSARLAVSYHQKAAELGNAWSLFAIGGIYDKGIGTKRNWALARDYYEQTLARGGQAEKRAAAFALAQLYLHKPHISSRRAAEYLEIGRRNGDAWSAFMLAGLYRQGRGVAKSTATARQLYTEVRRGPNAAAATSAAFELGRIYMSGTPQNLRFAEDNFAFAAARKDVWSAYFLAEIYMKQKPVTTNRRKARALLLTVSHSNDPQARAAAAELLKRLH